MKKNHAKIEKMQKKYFDFVFLIFERLTKIINWYSQALFYPTIENFLVKFTSIKPRTCFDFVFLDEKVSRRENNGFACPGRTAVIRIGRLEREFGRFFFVFLTARGILNSIIRRKTFFLNFILSFNFIEL